MVAFDGSLYSESALNYALEISKEETENIITGIFIEDLNYAYLFSNFGVDPTGYELSGDYGVYMDELRQSQEEIIQKSREAFINRCEESNANYTTHYDEGVTALELIRESAFADLLIIGYQTYFSNTGRENDQKVLKDILKDAKCPVLIVPEQMRPIKNIIFTYNGQDDSVYAIKHFTYLLKPSFGDVNYQLLHVQDDSENIVINEDLVREYLHQHYPNIKYEFLEGKPEIKIQEFVTSQPDALLVLGSFGKNALSRLLASSVAEEFLQQKTTPVFIAHR